LGVKKKVAIDREGKLPEKKVYGVGKSHAFGREKKFRI